MIVGSSNGSRLWLAAERPRGQEKSIDSGGRATGALLQARRRSAENAGSVMLRTDGGVSTRTFCFVRVEGPAFYARQS